MKNQFAKLRRRVIFGSLITAATIVIQLSSPTRCGAQVITLHQNNATAVINAAPAAGNAGGLTNWTVEGINQTVQQWFWFRIGSTGPEMPINSIGPATITTLGGRGAFISYYNQDRGYGIEVDYLLTGQSPGSGLSDISKSLIITNNTASPLEFHLFQYSNFQPSGDPLFNTAQLGTDIYGKYDEASVFKFLLGSNEVIETIVSPGADHAEAALAPFTFNRLTDNLPTSLNDDIGPSPTGNATYAFEWDLTIAPMDSQGISTDMYLHTTPEPSSALLIVLGLSGYALSTRKSPLKK